MAKARLIPPPEPIVQLELTIEEAKVLATILHRIGGSPRTSRRGSVDSILMTLVQVNIEATYSNELSTGSALIFNDKKETKNV